MLGFFRKLRGVDLADLMPRIMNDEIVLIDLRSAAEIKSTGHATGALSIPLESLAAAADPKAKNRHSALSPQTPIALYCASGARAIYGKRILHDLGYAEVYNLGGLKRWIKAGGAVTQ